MQKLLFVQFANSMYKRHDSCDFYWETFYKRWEEMGYYMGRYTFEIPKWIAEISYFLNGEEKEVFYCLYDISEVNVKIANGNYDFVLFSLMNANQHFIYDIIKANPNQKFLVGGYNDEFMKRMSEELTNVSICDTTKDTASKLSADYKFGTDYTMFSGERVVPRLTMSYGCLNRCKFCIVPHGKITSVDKNVIEEQINSFQPLDYRLIYLDDKTFGQADNYRFIKEMTYLTGKDDFNGYIVQTTSPMLVKKSDDFAQIGVKVAEIGLETHNDWILRKYNKPSNEAMVQKAVEACQKNGISLIANIIVGMPEETEETYQKTYDYVMSLLKEGKLIGINPSIYTDYENEENLGEIDFLEDEKTALHRKWWAKFNNTAADILSI